VHLVADSGSSKTDWKVIGQNSQEFQTVGFNPMTQKADWIAEQLPQPEILAISNKVTKLDFFGAGCAQYEACEKMKDILQKQFPNAKINVESDLKAAALALFGNQEGIVCILGTGSNAALYQNNKLIQNVLSLGHLLGDDGGGYSLGKAFLRSYLYGQKQWTKAIEDIGLETDSKTIIKKLYNSPRPNGFVAQYAQVVIANQNEDFFKEIINEEISKFFKYFVIPYKNESRQIGFVGSVAFHCQQIIAEIAKENGFEIQKIIQQPIEELSNFLGQSSNQ